jgi:DeoR/GlpR family transcriptional regulator of sugar metabolism
MEADVRGDQLARQWQILRTIESRNHEVTVADLAAQEGCHSRTIWRDLAAIQEAVFPLYSEAHETGRLIGGVLRYLSKSEHRGSKFRTRNSEPIFCVRLWQEKK